MGKEVSSCDYKQTRPCVEVAWVRKKESRDLIATFFSDGSVRFMSKARQVLYTTVGVSVDESFLSSCSQKVKQRKFWRVVIGDREFPSAYKRFDRYIQRKKDELEFVTKEGFADFFDIPA